jgi:3-methyladenine DNA glycosylase Tag
MKNTTIETMRNRLKVLKADIDNTQDITKLQREQGEAQAVINEITKKINELTAIESYDAAVITPEIDKLKALNVVAGEKLSVLNATITTALEAHNAAYAEFAKIKAGIESLTDLSTTDYQKMVDAIKTPQA